MQEDFEKTVRVAVATIRRQLAEKQVGKEELTEACFVVSQALIEVGIRPLCSGIRPKYKGRQMRENWSWDICYGLSGGTTHVFNWKTDTTIWPGRFTADEAVQFARDMHEGGFLKQISKRRPKV